MQRLHSPPSSARPSPQSTRPSTPTNKPPPASAPSSTSSPPSASTHSAIDWSQLDLSLLQVDPRVGLTDADAEQLRAIFGYNEIVEPKRNRWKRFVGYFTGSIAYLIEAAAILSAALRDWLNFGIISALLLVNALIGWLEEEKAENAVDALKSTLALRCRLLRSGRLRETEARVLVPGDVVQLRSGDVVSADAVVLPAVRKDELWKGLTVENGRVQFLIERPGQGEKKVSEPDTEQTKGAEEEEEEEAEEEQVTLQVDQSALTGESLPVNKHPGELLYSSSLIKAGQASALVIRTGQRTFIGRAANLIAITTEAGHFQQIIQRIGNFLILITVVLVSIVFIIGVTVQHHPITRQLQNCLVICIASIPVALPTVLSVTMAVGAQQLAKKKVIVKRLTAVEEMAGMDVLCSDKTGTLTKNQLSTDQPYLLEGHTEDELLLDAFLASEHATADAIDLCLRQKAIERVEALKGLKVDEADVPGWRLLSHTPFNATSKIASSVVRRASDGRVLSVMKGAPHKVFARCDMSDSDKLRAEQATEAMALRGLRALAVAVSEPYQGKRAIDELRWHCVGCISLLDPPRDDSAETIRRLQAFGIAVKMITGDTILIAREIAKRLGLHRNILSPYLIQRAEQSENITAKQLLRIIEAADGFAQVVPEDKYRVVELLQLGEHLVGMTGDGVNDCVEASTPVLLADNTVKLARNVAKGDRLLGTGGRAALVTSAPYTRPTAVMYRITATSGASFVVTPRHLVTLAFLRRTSVRVTRKLGQYSKATVHMWRSDTLQREYQAFCFRLRGEPDSALQPGSKQNAVYRSYEEALAAYKAWEAANNPHGGYVETVLQMDKGRILATIYQSASRSAKALPSTSFFWVIAGRPWTPEPILVSSVQEARDYAWNWYHFQFDADDHEADDRSTSNTAPVRLAAIDEPATPGTTDDDDDEAEEDTQALANTIATVTATASDGSEAPHPKRPKVQAGKSQHVEGNMCPQCGLPDTKPDSYKHWSLAPKESRGWRALQHGDLFEVLAGDLATYVQRHPLNAPSQAKKGALFGLVRSAMPTAADASPTQSPRTLARSAATTAQLAAGAYATAGAAFIVQAQNRVLQLARHVAGDRDVCANFLQLVTGSNAFRPLLATDKVQLGLVLDSPLSTLSLHNAQGQQAQSIVQLRRALSAFNVPSISAADGVFITGLNPIASSTGQIDSSEDQYTLLCKASMELALGTGAQAFVVFGRANGRRWRAHAHELPGVTRYRTEYSDADRVWSTWLYMKGERRVRVVYAPQLCMAHKLLQVMLAIRAARAYTGVPYAELPKDDEELDELERISETVILQLQSVTHEPVATTCTGWQVDGDGRFVLGNGVLTHNSPALKKANVGIAVHGCTDAARAAAAIVLLQPGLGTICDGIVTSRAIFQRMQSYSLYRITSTIHFLLFLFLSILIFDFTIPAVLIVLITVMNDAATLVISVDNAQISQQPEKWRLGQLIVLSFLLAALLTASSFAHFLIFRSLQYSIAQLGTILYLQMSSSPHFVIFSTRIPGPWYSNMPSVRFSAAILGTQAVAMLFAVYGVVSAPVGWSVSAVVMGVSLLYFMLLDAVKCAVYRWWSLERTLWMWPTRSRRERVNERREERQRKLRLRAVVRRLRRVMNAVWFLRLLREARLEAVLVERREEERSDVEEPKDTEAQQEGGACLGCYPEGVDRDDCVEMAPLEWDEKSSMV